MKPLLIFIAMFIACSLQAQIHDPPTIESNLQKYGSFFIDDVADRTSGYAVTDPDLDVGDWSISCVLGLPQYYSFDLVRMDINTFASSYHDITSVQGWRPAKHGHTRILRFDLDYLLLFYYFPDRNFLTVRLAYRP